MFTALVLTNVNIVLSFFLDLVLTVVCFRRGETEQVRWSPMQQRSQPRQPGCFDRWHHRNQLSECHRAVQCAWPGDHASSHALQKPTKWIVLSTTIGHDRCEISTGYCKQLSGQLHGNYEQDLMEAFHRGNLQCWWNPMHNIKSYTAIST